MYPSFQLVLNFVKDPQWTQAQFVLYTVLSVMTHEMGVLIYEDFG